MFKYLNADGERYINPKRLRINPRHPLARGLYACWPLMEGEGDIVNDIAGHFLHGYLGAGVAQPVWVTERGGYALKFDGGDNVELTATTLGLNYKQFKMVTSTGRMSISCWARVTSLTNSQVYIGQCSTSSPQPFFLRYQGSAGNVRFSLTADGGTTTATVTTTSNAVVANVWHHACGTWDGQTIKIYLNGIAGPTAALVGPMTPYQTTPFLGQNNAAGAALTGMLQDIRIYDWELPPDAVRSLYDDPWGIYRPHRFFMYDPNVTAATGPGSGKRRIGLVGV